jgi:hypothetical protein
MRSCKIEEIDMQTNQCLYYKFPRKTEKANNDSKPRVEPMCGVSPSMGKQRISEQHSGSSQKPHKQTGLEELALV